MTSAPLRRSNSTPSISTTAKHVSESKGDPSSKKFPASLYPKAASKTTNKPQEPKLLNNFLSVHLFGSASVRMD